MSSENARPDIEPARRGVAPGTKTALLWSAPCLLIGLGVFLAPGELMIAGFGMIPTAAAAFADTSQRRSLTQCVGAMNFAGDRTTVFVIIQRDVVDGPSGFLERPRKMAHRR